jgi:PAS domain S-box-containing protein
MFGSLKSRILVTIIGVVSIFIATSSLFYKHSALKALSDSLDNNALNLLDAIKSNVATQHNSILYFQNAMLTRRKIELKNNTTIAFAIVNSAYQRYQAGEISEGAAQASVINEFKQLRYDNGIGYFWVNDMTRPYPRMIVHPTIPDLDGEILDDETFNCALGENENLFKAFVDVCLVQGDGYVDYEWPKPLPSGLTEQQPKLSYVKMFAPWNWVIGTGVYIDDIEKDVQDRLVAVIEELNLAISNQRIGKSGYFFIFDEDYRLLVHPTLADTDGSVLVNPETGDKLLAEIKQIAHRPDQSMEYLWDKPEFREEYRFPKKAFVTLFEPLGWYISTSFYLDDYENIIARQTNIILVFSLSFLLIAIVVSLIVSKSIVKPLSRLVHAIGHTDDDGMPIDTVPTSGTNEVRLLSSVINGMITTIDKSRCELRAQRDYSMDIINVSPYIICGIDKEGQITFINPAGEKATERARDKLVGREWREIFDPTRILGEDVDVIDAFVAGILTNQQLTLECAYRGNKTVVWDGLVKRNELGELQEVIGFGNDITELKDIERQLENSNVELESHKEHLEELVEERTSELQASKKIAVGNAHKAGMAIIATGVLHDVGNLLNSIATSAFVIRDVMRNGFKNKLDTANKILEANVDNLDRFVIEDPKGKKLIKYYLELGQIYNTNHEKIESEITRVEGKIDASKNVISSQQQYAGFSSKQEKNSLKTIIQDSVNLEAETLRRANVDLAVNLEDADVVADKSKMLHVVVNLLKNAIEAFQDTPVDCRRIDIESKVESEKVLLTVTDSGFGIESDKLETIFAHGFTTKEKGFGFGLHSCANYVKEIGGNMYAKSPGVGCGATFVIELPRMGHQRVESGEQTAA